MRVGVREYRREEIQRICGSPADALVSYYTLRRNKNDAIMADVTDARARKNINFDYYAMTASSLFLEAVRPIMRTLLPPVLSPQVVVVVDGSSTTRFHTLLDPTEGLVPLCLNLMMDPTGEFAPLLEEIHVALVELDSNNRLRDMAPAAAVRKKMEDEEEEPVIIEDEDEHFTSVEDASYMTVRTEEDIWAVVEHAQRVVSSERHQVFSFILSYKESTGLPNSTIQFVALSVSEVARGMQSTRHCITASASLIESRSPSITFEGTKLLFLLKPALLGKQPGLWISCFAPTTTAAPKERETFKESFCIAYTLSRIYSSRVGVEMSEACQRITDLEDQKYTGKNPDEYVEIPPRTSILKPSYLNVFEKPRRKSTSSESRPSISLPVISSSSSNGDDEQQQQQQPRESLSFGMSDSTVYPFEAFQQDTPAGLLVTPSGQRLKPIDDKRTPVGKRKDNISTGRQPLRRPSHESCSSIESHPYNCSARYEFETYRRVMEPAMNQLRIDIQHYMTELEDARHQIRQMKRAQSAQGGVEELQASLLVAKRERASLELEFAKREEILQSKVNELQICCSNLARELHAQAASSFSEEGRKIKRKNNATQTPVSFPLFSSSSSFHPIPASAPGPHQFAIAGNDFVGSQVPPKDSLQNESHSSSQWLEVVNYHQRELEDCAEREHSYRSRIIFLEQSLNEREAEVAQLRAEMTRRDYELLLEAVKSQQRKTEQEMERNYFESLQRLRSEIVDANKSTIAIEHRLEMCLNELKQEQKQRESSEAELHRLQATCVQHMEGGAPKELVQMLKDSYERQVHHLQREVEELRATSKQVSPSNEVIPRENTSVASSPKQKTEGRPPAGMGSPVVEAPETKLRLLPKYPVNDDNHIPNDAPPMQAKTTPTSSGVKRFEDFMKEESTYTFRLPKAITTTFSSD